MKDYYRTLGVIDDAEDIVIRAAYKALAQRYHPDKWKGDPSESNRRMSDINEAYEVISDPEKRKKYDEDYFRHRARDESNQDDDGDANFISEDDEAWQYAIQFFPNIIKEYDELGKISKVLANTYKANLISNREYNISSELKNRLLKEYLIRYYGESQLIQNFAKILLLNGYQKAAIEVNKLVRYMGKSIDENKIINYILSEFNPKFDNIKDNAIIKYIDKIKNKKITVEEIYYLLKIIDPSIKQEESYYDGTYTVALNGKKYSMDHTQIIEFISSNLFINI